MPKIEADQVVEVTEIFSKEPLEIARDPEKRKKVIAYLRAVRENIAEIEEAGQRISKKAKLEGSKKPVLDPNVDPLDAILGGSS